MSLYQRINKMCETIDSAKKTSEFYRDSPRPSDEELRARELRAIEHLLEKVSDNLPEICDVLKLGKEYIDQYDLSDVPPTYSSTEFKGIPLLEAVAKTEDESFVLALMSNGKFAKVTCKFDKKMKCFTEIAFQDVDLEDMLKMVPCEEMFKAIEKGVKEYDKRIKDSKPEHIKRQEFLIKIGG